MRYGAGRAFGGTLLEVLVSLVILTLVSSSILETVGHRRRAFQEHQRAELGLQHAVLWRTARASKAVWAQGDAGRFPAETAFFWELGPVSVSAEKLEPDSRWRQLLILHEEAGHVQRHSFLFRLEDSPATSAEGGAP